jgi:hypothetical protein
LYNELLKSKNNFINKDLIINNKNLFFISQMKNNSYKSSFANLSNNYIEDDLLYDILLSSKKFNEILIHSQKYFEFLNINYLDHKVFIYLFSEIIKEFIIPLSYNESNIDYIYEKIIDNESEIKKILNSDTYFDVKYSKVYDIIFNPDTVIIYKHLESV